MWEERSWNVYVYLVESVIKYRYWDKVIHGDLRGKLGYDKDEKYYNPGPQPVHESTHSKLLWDFKIPTDNEIKPKSEIVVLDKIEWKCQFIDVACPCDTRMKDKAKEKFENCQTLKR